ncbi:MAG: hypothetical protein AAGC44_01700 [Planctomycetota bacterium]
MITQEDVQQVEAELQELRTQLMIARDRVRPRLDDLVERTEKLQADDEDSGYMPTLNRVHELLLLFQRGFEVDDHVRRIARLRVCR